MKLKRPTDFLILECFAAEGRNIGANIALVIEKKRSYVNTRLPMLEAYGLIRKIGPSERSGLYEITALGEVALENREAYGDDEVDFDKLIEQELAQQCSEDESEPEVSA